MNNLLIIIDDLEKNFGSVQTNLFASSIDLEIFTSDYNKKINLVYKTISGNFFKIVFEI